MRRVDLPVMLILPGSDFVLRGTGVLCVPAQAPRQEGRHGKKDQSPKKQFGLTRAGKKRKVILPTSVKGLLKEESTSVEGQISLSLRIDI